MLLFLLLFCHRMLAEHIDPKTAYQVATHYLNTLNDGKNCVQQELVDVTSQTPFTHFYVFKNEHSFVLVSADDRTIPILGYSTTETFVTGDLPENILSWLQAYDDEIKHIAEKKLEASAETKSQWEALKKGAPSRTREVVVGPLIQTKWNQDNPYNRECPAGCLTGCVATAMAQLIRYWEFPASATGKHSYVEPSGVERSANFCETIYDWGNMPESLNGSASEAEIQAVATLMYHCGVSVNMKYSQGSGANSSFVPTALIRYFDYDESATKYVSKPNNEVAWAGFLKSELNEGRPLYYFGGTQYSSHAFLCDGYDSDGLFHFNWGWSGSNDGYYAIGALNPASFDYSANNAVVKACPNFGAISAPHLDSPTLQGENVTLSWSAVDGASAYDVYRDFECIASDVTGTSFVEENVPYGDLMYFVKAVAEDVSSCRSNSHIVARPYPGPVAQNFHGEVDNDALALSWEDAVSGEGELYYSKVNVNATGFGDLADFQYGQKYPVDMLKEHVGKVVTKLSVYFYGAGKHTLYLAQGDFPPDYNLFSMDYISTGPGWQTITLTNPVYFDCDKPLWFYVCAYTTSHGGCGGVGVYGNHESPNGGYYHNGFWVNMAISWCMSVTVDKGEYSYDLYRNEECLAEDIAACSYRDANPADGLNAYYVKTRYYGKVSPQSDVCKATRLRFYANGENMASSLTMEQEPFAPFPTPTAINGYESLGWASSETPLPTQSAPSLVDAATYTLSGNGHLHAVYGIAKDAQSHWYSTTVTPLSGTLTSGTYATNCYVSAPTRIPNDAVVVFPYGLGSTNPSDLVIEDGGQLFVQQPNVKATVQKHIAACTGSRDGYYLVSSPMTTNMAGHYADGTFDLYRYDEPNHLWGNYESEAFDFVAGQAYLYANETDRTVLMAGELNTDDVSVNLSCRAEDLPGFNLVGNPYTHAIAYPASDDLSAGYYLLNASGNAFDATLATEPIAPSQGFLVQATQATTMTFTNTMPTRSRDIVPSLEIAVGDGKRSDKAYLVLGEGNSLEKISHLDENAPMLYLRQGKTDCAIATMSELPESVAVSFKAGTDGTYSLSVKADGIATDYMHLLDNKTGAEHDLLALPTYSFEASRGDYASRFRIVFGAEGDDTEGESFVHIEGGNLVVENSGSAILQVVDVMGRVLVSERIEGSCSKGLGFSAGVYAVSLIGNDKIRTQKIVIDKTNN